jgi:membrane-associated phospholipid phosphatase
MGAAGCTVLLAATWLTAFHVSFVQRADRSIFVSFYDLTFLYYRHRIDAATNFFVSLCNPRPYVYLALVVAAIALVQRLRLAFCAAAILAAANVTTQLLKRVVPQQRSDSLLGGASPVPHVSWPSGHATAAMALVLALTVVAPGRIRPWVAGGGAVLASAVGYSLMARGTHYPSDVLGGFLVAAIYSLLAVASLQASDSGSSAGRASARVSLRQALVPMAAAGIGAVALGVFLLIDHVHEAANYARAHGAFVLGATGIFATSLAITIGVLITAGDGGRVAAAQSSRRWRRPHRTHESPPNAAKSLRISRRS